MASLFDRFRGRKQPSSAEIAKERLQLVLVTDRSNLSPEKLEEMQREIIDVIKRYIPIDAMEVQINIEQRQRKHYLVADVPLNRDPNYGAIDAPEGGAAPDAASGSDMTGSASDDNATSGDSANQDSDTTASDAAADTTSDTAADASNASATRDTQPGRPSGA